MGVILRILLMIGIILLAVYCVRYLLHPKRKLELAHEKQRTFLLDDPRNVRKNFLLTYKGVMFEGEKHLGMTDEAFAVTRIFVWARDPARLNGFSKEDFFELERIISEGYPAAKVEWKSPISNLFSR